MRALRLVRHARLLKRALLDRESPLQARLLVIAMIAYVVSPIDLISDFIPIIGWIDDAAVVALGTWLVERWLPPAMLKEDV
ncbi:YkvA family protein [Roseiterribacter gracilis]|uniref:DUF1232 domain-containing protein n=1 Tax=Roseiterribacter gracilis TaxID=2812848 RepID=A0A8S8X6S6_9PROT|nr:hypothetical protein TMPK1_00310 [Rhodospirillales bacterium TMPK1]